MNSTQRTSPIAPVSSFKLTALSNPWFLLISRSMLFLVIQALIAAVLAATGTKSAWNESARWWVFIAILANIVSIYLLVYAYRAEGQHYLDSIRFSRATFKTDLIWFFGSSIVGVPIMGAPMNTLAATIFGDAMIPVNMLFISLPTWALVLGILFPLTIAFAELPTYFGYVMPRLELQLKNGWLAWLLAAFFLAAQHMFLPLLPDVRFMLWRFGMFLPFALFAGLVIKLRPTLLPYFMIVHILADMSTLAVYLMI